MRLKNKYRIISIAFLALLLLSSCSGKDKKELGKIFSDIDNNTKYEYDKEIRTIKRNEKIEFDVKKDIDFSKIEEDGHSKLEVYGDRELQSKSYFAINHTNKYDGKIRITPNYAYYFTDIMNKDEPRRHIVDENDWGSLNYFYIVQRADLKTGEKLEKPKVITYKLDHEEDKLKAPFVEYEISDNGELLLSWDPVEGATEYHIVGINQTIFDGTIRQDYDGIYSTKDTHMKSFDLPKNLDQEEDLFVQRSNGELIDKETRSNDEDRMIYKIVTDKNTMDFLEAEQDNLAEQRKLIKSKLVVLASDGKELSPMSNELDFSHIRKNLPIGLAMYTWLLDNGGKEAVNSFDQYDYLYYKNLDQIPKSMPVTMANGETKYLPVKIGTDNIDIKERDNVNYKMIPFKVQGTPISGSFGISDYNRESFITEVKDIAKKFDSENVTGTMKTSVNIAELSKEYLDSKVIMDKVPDNIDKEIFATDRLEYFIAANLLNLTDVIDIKDYPEAKDGNYFMNAYKTAFYENRNIPYIVDINISKDGEKYEFVYSGADKDIMKKHQKEVEEKMNSVASEIFKPNMTDIEKVRAINKYLVDNGEYDFEAYKNKQNLYSEDRFKKSFMRDRAESLNAELLYDNEEAYSIYGIAVKGKGVCGSYAMAFDYLAELAGLEARVVLGNVNGQESLGHAWNAIKIDGEWKYFDTTWNDNDVNTEEFFNIDINDKEFNSHHTATNLSFLDMNN